MEYRHSTSMLSPFSGGACWLVSGVDNYRHNGRTVFVRSEFYRCQQTGQEFTTTEQDEAWLKELRACSILEE